MIDRLIIVRTNSDSASMIASIAPRPKQLQAGIDHSLPCRVSSSAGQHAGLSYRIIPIFQAEANRVIINERQTGMLPQQISEPATFQEIRSKQDTRALRSRSATLLMNSAD